MSEHKKETPAIAPPAKAKKPAGQEWRGDGWYPTEKDPKGEAFTSTDPPPVSTDPPFVSTDPPPVVDKPA